MTKQKPVQPAAVVMSGAAPQQPAAPPSDEAASGVRANVSGRWWKSTRTEKSRMMVLRPLRRALSSSWEKKLASHLRRSFRPNARRPPARPVQLDRVRQKETKELEKEMLQRAKEQRQQENDARVAKRKRKAENELANTKYQVISDPQKLKRLTKKQMRMIQKTQMGEDGVVRLVGAFD
jgi:hypothetical protein